MFDRVIAPQPAKRWKTFLLIGTAGGHAAVLAALVIVAFWRIEKLPLSGDREIRVTVQPERPPPGGPPPGEKLAVQDKHIVKPPPPPVPVQPVHLEQQPFLRNWTRWERRTVPKQILSRERPIHADISSRWRPCWRHVRGSSSRA